VLCQHRLQCLMLFLKLSSQNIIDCHLDRYNSAVTTLPLTFYNQADPRLSIHCPD